MYMDLLVSYSGYMRKTSALNKVSRTYLLCLYRVHVRRVKYQYWTLWRSQLPQIRYEPLPRWMSCRVPMTAMLRKALCHQLHKWMMNWRLVFRYKTRKLEFVLPIRQCQLLSAMYLCHIYEIVLNKWRLLYRYRIYKLHLIVTLFHLWQMASRHRRHLKRKRFIFPSLQSLKVSSIRYAKRKMMLSLPLSLPRPHSQRVHHRLSTISIYHLSLIHI